MVTDRTQEIIREFAYWNWADLNGVAEKIMATAYDGFPGDPTSLFESKMVGLVDEYAKLTGLNFDAANTELSEMRHVEIISEEDRKYIAEKNEEMLVGGFEL